MMLRKSKILGLRIWRQWIKPFAIILLVLGSFRSAIADWNDVPSGSMRPTIFEGDRIFVNKLAYDLKVPFTTWHIASWASPRRGDVVVFFSPDDGKRLVKRVIGLPGDRIELQDNTLYINGQRASYHDADWSVLSQLTPNDTMQYQVDAEILGTTDHPVMRAHGPTRLMTVGPVIVPEHSYFVMGDNRDNSRDSRIFGFVPRDRIVGQATAVVLSFDRDHYYMPRWERFFTAMP